MRTTKRGEKVKYDSKNADTLYQRSASNGLENYFLTCISFISSKGPFRIITNGITALEDIRKRFSSLDSGVSIEQYFYETMQNYFLVMVTELISNVYVKLHRVFLTHTTFEIIQNILLYFQLVNYC